MVIGMVTCPVCGMNVAEKVAKWTSDYAGRKYFFCSEQDKKTFDADPKRYAR